jgi:hypothetical protein
MRDQLVLGGWDEQVSLFIGDLVAYPAAIMKGPIVEARQATSWKKKGKQAVLEVKATDTPVFRRVDPYDYYPSPLSTGPVIERVWIPKEQLAELADRPDYSKKAIDQLLDSTVPIASAERADVDDKLEATGLGESTDVHDEMSGVLECLEFHGFIPGKLLISHGLEKDPSGKALKHKTQYFCTILSVPGGPVLRASVVDDPLSRAPYHVCSWMKISDAVWAMGIPQQISALQDICDGSLRAMVRNMGFASGPQVVVTDLDRLPEGEDIEELYALKIWQFTNERGSTLDPLKFLIVPSIAKELNEIYQQYAAMADEVTGLPKFDADMARSAGRTSTGLGMIMAGASKEVKRVVRRVHDLVIGPCLQRLAEWDMRFIDDPEIKGDAQVVATGAVARVVREQLVQRRIEYLNITNNPVDLKLVGSRNRAEMLRAVAQTLELGDGVSTTLTDAEIDELVARDDAERTQAAQSAQEVQAAKASQAQADASAKTSKAQTDASKAQSEANFALQELEIRKQRMDLDHQIALAKIEVEKSKIGLTATDNEAQRTSDDIDTIAKHEIEMAKAKGAGTNDKGKSTGAGAKGSTVA